ncbi:MAG: glycosyltransferase family 39 protein [Planctomycetota bacterium]
MSAATATQSNQHAGRPLAEWIRRIGRWLQSPAGMAAALGCIGALIWCAVAMWTRPGIPLDMAEMIGWGHQWQWGYHKHPPLPCWIGEAIWSTTGSRLMVHLFSQGATLVSLACVYRVASQLLSPVHGLVAVAALQLSYYTHLTTLDLNHTITCRLFWSLSLWSFFEAVTRPPSRGSSWWWVSCGVCLGLGGLAKYYIAVLAGCFALVPLAIPAYRHHLRRAGPWLMIAVASVVVSPHIVWLFQNDFAPLQYAMQRGSTAGAGWLDHLLNPLVFLLKQAAVWGPMSWFVYRVIASAGSGDSLGDDDDSANRLRLTYLLVLGPVFGFLLASATTGASLRSMWGGPLWTFLPVCLLAWHPVRLNPNTSRRVFRFGAVACGVMACVGVVGNVSTPLMKQRPSRHHFATRELAEEIDTRWSTVSDEPLPIIAGPFFVASLVNMHHGDRPTVYYDAQPALAPWTSDTAMQASGGVLIWPIRSDKDRDMPTSWRDRFPTAVALEPVSVDALTPNAIRPQSFGLAAVPPATRAAESSDAISTALAPAKSSVHPTKR